MLKEHPAPNVDAYSAPRPDKYLTDFLGRRFPKDMDSKLSSIQAAVLAIGHPTLSAWQGMVEGGLDEDPDMVVPAAEVLNLCQRILCLVGNASPRRDVLRFWR